MENNMVLKRILLGAGLFAAALVFKNVGWILYILVVILLGYDVAAEAVKNIFRGSFLDY